MGTALSCSSTAAAYRHVSTILSLQGTDRSNVLSSGESKEFVASPQLAVGGPWRLVLGPAEVLPWLEVLHVQIGQQCPFVTPGALSASLFSLEQLARPELELQAKAIGPGGLVKVTLRNNGMNACAVSLALSGSVAVRDAAGCDYHGLRVPGCSRCAAKRKQQTSIHTPESLDEVFGYDAPMARADYDPFEIPPFAPGSGVLPMEGYRPPEIEPRRGISLPPPYDSQGCPAKNRLTGASCILTGEHKEHVATEPLQVWVDAVRCGQPHPECASRCLRNRAHAGDHVDGLDRSWRDSRPICGARHPDRRELACERDQGHRHAHEADEHSWPQQQATPSREELARAELDGERYLDDGWNAWENPNDES